MMMVFAMHTGEYESVLSAILSALECRLTDSDVTADVTEFTFRQLLHDNTQTRDGSFIPCCRSLLTGFLSFNNNNNNVTYIAQIRQGRKCATTCQCQTGMFLIDF